MLQGTLLLLLLPAIDGGLEPPSDPWELFKILNGPLCECQGSASPVPPINYTQSTDCGTKKAYLFYYPHPEGRLDQCWACINKPKNISIKDGHPVLSGLSVYITNPFVLHYNCLWMHRPWQSDIFFCSIPNIIPLEVVGAPFPKFLCITSMLRPFAITPLAIMFVGTVFPHSRFRWRRTVR